MKAKITRNSRKFGYGVNTSPSEKWNDDFTQSNYYFEPPTKPDFEGTIKQVFEYIDNDPFIRSLKSGGTIYSSAFFINGKRINTDSQEWQYELDRLMDGEIDSLELPLIVSETSAAAAALGSARSEAKTAAARANGAKGGRPKKTE